MKIVRHTPKRRHNIHLDSSPAADTQVERPKKRKALLVGINTTLMSSGAGKKGGLKMPHRDVSAMKSLLIDQYGYNAADIVTLIDNNDRKQLQPTQANLLAEMNNLVADSKRGDRFFFHYCGHVVQKVNEDGSEEDGMDECLVPCDSDGDRNTIKDDILRKILVDQLSPGSHLIAVFDSCHSASLLDLEHFRCNRVYVPWMSKGRRRSDSMWNNVRRQPALISSRTIIQAQRIGKDKVKQRRTTLEELCPQSPPPSVPNTPPPPLSRNSTWVSTSPPSPVATTNISPTSTFNVSKAAKILAKLDPRGGGSGGTNSSSPDIANQNQRQTHHRQSLAIRTRSLKTVKSHFSPWLEDESPRDRTGDEDSEAFRQCESPIQEFCSGWCKPTGPDTPSSPPEPGCGMEMRQSNVDFLSGLRKEAEVISLASCKDSQISWESNGSSMTQLLVEILKNDPHPTLKDLMLNVSHKLHDAAVSMHGNTKVYKKRMIQWRKKHPEKAKARSEGDTAGLNMNNFQDPQLSSRKPLDMNSRWNL